MKFELLDVTLDTGNEFGKNFSISSFEVGKKYSILTEVTGQEGLPYSGYFAVYQMKNNKILDTKIRWFNDFSNIKKDIKIVFSAISNTIMIAYRINHYTSPTKSRCHFQLLPLNKAKISEVDLSQKEQFENLNDFMIDNYRELTSEEELLLEKNLVWIFGSNRSGTTWMARGLLSYNTYIMNEPLIGYHLANFTRSPEPITSTEQGELRNFYFFHRGYQNFWNPHLRKMILHRIFGQFPDLSRKIIIKEPNGSLGAGFLSKCLPNSKIIVVLRDGRDILDSLMASRKKGGYQEDRGWDAFNIDRTAYLEQQGKKWTKLMKIVMDAFNNHKKELRLLVRYEDLRNNTLEELQKIYPFLDINISHEQLKTIVEKSKFENIPQNLKGKGTRKRSASPGKWKVNFDVEEQKIMENTMGPMLRTLGYE